MATLCEGETPLRYVERDKTLPVRDGDKVHIWNSRGEGVRGTAPATNNGNDVKHSADRDGAGQIHGTGTA